MATEYPEVFATILQDTITELPGAMRAVAKGELRLTMREFFEKSYAWIANIDDIALTAGSTPVQIDSGDANSEVIGILSLQVGNATDGYNTLAPVSSRPARVETGDSPSVYYMTSNPDEFVLYPYAENTPTNVARAEVALIPAFDAEVLPRQITLKYYDAIVDGFLARMYAHPNKPYSAPMGAGMRRTSFVKAMGYYAAQRKQGYNGAPDWRFPAGWRVAKVGR